jgi:GT2 family glycosyltransferase
MKLSVIIPVGPHDHSWAALIGCLKGLNRGETEFIFSATSQITGDEDLAIYTNFSQERTVSWLVGNAGRAAQINRGVEKATAPVLWILHCDSIFGCDVLQEVSAASVGQCDGIYYFDLAFQEGSHFLMGLNRLGAKFRSDVLKMPFGDQGFLIGKNLLTELSGFDESLAYGEDHDLIWRFRHLGGIPKRLNGKVYTSARKYQTKGWLRTTVEHLHGTWKQAWPHITQRRIVP